MSSNKILILTSSFPNKDNQTSNGYFVYELANKLSKEFSVHVLCPHASGLKKIEKSNEIEITRFQYFFSSLQKLTYGAGISENLKTNKLNYLLIIPFIISQFFSTIKQLKKESYSLVHVHWLIPQGLTYALIRFFLPKSPPFIITSHGSDINKFNSPGILIKIKKWAINKAFKLITVSQSLKITCQSRYKVSSDHVLHIPTGIDTQIFKDEKKIRNNDFLYIGRLIEQKGILVLLQSISLLIKEKPDVQLTIVGEGPLKGEIKNFIHSHNLSNNIHLLGSVKHTEIPHFYNTHKFLIAPSIKPEGLGLTPIEAMACGCIPIVSDIPALNELVSNKTGYLVSPNNRQALFEKMEFVLNQSSQLQTKQKQAMKEFINQYSWDIIAEQHFVLYKHLLESQNK
ncbi:MAG: glycosyltransferase family 4 protein [Gammaproteobacteria bacterium]|nr:glycosyltransferase family 4 protein [Gammaproteobacteria bacterium]